MTEAQQVIRPNFASMTAEMRLQYENELQTSLRFTRKHPEYLVCDKNALAMVAEMDRINGGIKEWTVESLEKAFANIKDQLAQHPPVPGEDNLGWTIEKINALSGRELIAVRKDPEQKAAIDRVLEKFTKGRK